jgi:hypothetical protein
MPVQERVAAENGIFDITKIIKAGQRFYKLPNPNLRVIIGLSTAREHYFESTAER